MVRVRLALAVAAVAVLLGCGGASEYGDTTGYKIFVLAQDQRFALAEFEGDDGSGYYGTGFWFKVLAPTQRID